MPLWMPFFRFVPTTPGDIVSSGAFPATEMLAKTRLIFFYLFWDSFCKVTGPVSYFHVALDLYVICKPTA
jgi:hypothetical protein